MKKRTKKDLSWLGSLSLSTGKKPSLGAMRFLMKKLGHPERKTHFVHVAGTNGKGSVVEMAAKILEVAGYKVGKFMSPHLVRFNERIQINGQEITNVRIEEMLEFLEPIFNEFEKKYERDISLFEVETAMALVYFAEEACDIVALEVGLGGEWDCTNIVTADVSVITSIGYDHMNVLGDSLEEIAAQKAGIIKEGGMVVTGILPEEAENVVRAKCEKMGAELRIVAPEKVEIVKDGVNLAYSGMNDVEVTLRGKKQGENAAICIECMRILQEKGWKISEAAIREGLRKVVHHGRFETILEKPEIVFDGAHNLPAVENFWTNVETYYPESKKVFVVSLLKRKAYRAIFGKLLRPGEEYIFTTGNDEELYFDAEELKRAAEEIEPRGIYRTAEFGQAMEELKNGDKMGFVVGSFYVYGDAIKAVKNEKAGK